MTRLNLSKILAVSYQLNVCASSYQDVLSLLKGTIESTGRCEGGRGDGDAQIKRLFVRDGILSVADYNSTRVGVVVVVVDVVVVAIFTMG